MLSAQTNYDILCEWGLNGLHNLSPGSGIIIVVDVLSFSTSVDIACSRNALVYPFPWTDGKAEEFARSLDAVLAAPRSEKEYSLSPSSLLNIPSGTKLVLPSPNGSSLSLPIDNKPVLCGCLRNCKAVAEYALSLGSKISVIPAGEKWPDGSIRFAIEDLLGAGSVISYLNGSLSPESILAKNAFESAKNNIFDILSTCYSGKELEERGFKNDILLASELNSSTAVPVLKDGAFRNKPVYK